MAIVVLVLGTTLAGAAVVMEPDATLLGWLPSNGAVPTPTPTAAPAVPVPGSGAGETSVATAGQSATGPAPATTRASAPNAPSPEVSTSALAAPAVTQASMAPPTPAAPSQATNTASTTSVPTRLRVVYHGDRHRKVVALTFDDGYSPTALRQILAILKRDKVGATFFPYGWAVHQDPAGWHMVVAAGYPIGNHTLSHPLLTRLTYAQVITEMIRGRRTIDLYSGGRSADYMRPPGGALNAATARAILKAGYPTIVMWDVDTLDWQRPSVATIVARAIRGTNGSIVLMHSGPRNTPRALPAIIASYRARGFTLVTISELLADLP
jgi:peptidoglycan/xylan/chitin deacetylase (PgdA/CDA1 family)